MYRLSPSLSSHDRYKIRKSGLEKALKKGTWKDYLPIEKSSRSEDLLEKFYIGHFHLTTKEQRVDSKAIALFIPEENGYFYIFHVSDTHEGFTRYAGKDCSQDCKKHIKKALDTLLKEREDYCRNNINMIYFNNSFFKTNNVRNSGNFFLPFEDNGEIAKNILRRFIDEVQKAEISPPFTIDSIINKLDIRDNNKDIAEFIKSKIERKKKFTSKEELIEEISGLSYTNQNIAEKYLEGQHKLLKPLNKPWKEITDKDIIDAMNNEVTSFFNDVMNHMYNPSEENLDKLSRQRLQS